MRTRTLFSLFLLLVGLRAHGQQVFLEQTEQGLSVTWNSVAGERYEVQASDDFSSWTQVAEVTADAERATLAVPTGGAFRFYRLARKPYAASLTVVRDGAELIVTATASAHLQYAALFDVCEGRTNRLQAVWGSDIRPTFTVDPVRLKNGVRHHLHALLVDNWGNGLWSDRVRLVQTEPAVLVPDEPLTLNHFGTTERMFYLSFSPAVGVAHGSWEVSVDDARGQRQWTWAGSIEDSLVNGEILVRDESRRANFKGYDAAAHGYFLVRVTVRPEGGGETSIEVVSPIAERAPPGMVVIEDGTHAEVTGTIEAPNLVKTALERLGLDYAKQNGSAIPQANEWDLFEPSVVDYLSARAPSHCFVGGWGGPSALSDLVPKPASRVATFVIAAGGNAQLGLLDSLLGVEGGDFHDVTVRGRFPRFGLTFINARDGQADFLDAFMRACTRLDVLAFRDYPTRYSQALAEALAHYPEMEGHVYTTGFDGFIDQ